MKYPLVTILSPVYNGETYISRFIESILNQNYPNIELIIVNDGSIDNTEKILKSYEKKLTDKLSNYKYIKQKNMGAAGAINTGLKHVNGKYLTWPDSDDVLYPDSIKKRIDFLKKTKYKFVIGKAAVYDEHDLSKILYTYELKKANQNTNIFELLLMDKKAYYCPGCYMVDFDAFKSVNPNLDLYISKGGQNWQMLLPISFVYECGYIDEYVYKYIIRATSHSHIGMDDYIHEKKRIDRYEDIIINVLNSMNISINERNKYISMIKNKYFKVKRNLCFKFNNKKEFKQNYSGNYFFELILYYLKKIIDFIEKLPMRVINKIRKIVLHDKV